MDGYSTDRSLFTMTAIENPSVQVQVDRLRRVPLRGLTTVRTGTVEDVNATARRMYGI
jgi:hypothetical protein